jgi:hypothetical protein
LHPAAIERRHGIGREVSALAGHERGGRGRKVGVAVEAPADTPSTDASPPSKPKRAERPLATAPASLTVVVYPWGDVWINGQRRGSAPLKGLSLKPGRYEIAAGQGEPTVTQTIRLRSGENKKLKLDVTK